MTVLIFIKPRHWELKPEMPIAYPDKEGQFTKVGVILSKDKHNCFTLSTGGAYTADELRFLMPTI